MERYKYWTLIIFLSFIFLSCNDRLKLVEKYENGVIKSEGYIQNGKKNGLAKLYYETEVLKQKGNWVDDLQEGIWKYYYPDGKVQAIVHFRNGRQDGKSYFFRQGGEKEQTLNYRFGKLDGVCTTFYLNNSLKSISKWENGNKKDVTFFDSLK